MTPKLEITGKAGGIPILAQCSICRGRTAFKADGDTADNNTKSLEEQLQKHVRKAHGDEDVNQAAARIVRQATER